MASNLSFPGSGNVFLPSFQATGDMVVAYSRHPNQFPLNEYVKLVPVKEEVGEYVFIDPMQAVRITQDTTGQIGSNYTWPDGQFRPGFSNLDASNNLQFKFKPYICRRFNYPAMYGKRTVQQAAWDLVGEQQGQLATKAMLMRTAYAVNVLSNQATQTATATTAGGGFWSAGTITTPYIRKSIAYGAQAILAATAGAIDYESLVLVIGPKVAAAMGNSAEMYDYVAHQASSPQIQRDAGNKGLYRWQLPTEIDGVKVVVETSQINTNQINSGTNTAADVINDNEAYLLARPGSLVTGAGKSFSTLMMPVYSKYEMLMQTMDDEYNDIVRMNVVDMFDMQLSASETLFKFTSVLS